jgi:type IV pilus assembly protein PilC
MGVWYKPERKPGREPMPVFTYVALEENGATRTGEESAESEPHLRAELARRGLIVERVRSHRVRTPWRGDRVGTEEFALFNQEFVALVRAGLTVPDVLALVADRPDSPVLARVLKSVLADVRNGMPLSAACEKHPRVFERLYTAALRTAEKTGDLVNVLVRHQDHLRQRVAIRKKIRQALTYPAFLLVALVIILLVLFVFVMPRFVAMYADLGAELPAPTRMLMSVVKNFYVVAPLVVATGVLCTMLWRKWVSTPSGRKRVDAAWSRLPYVGELIRVVSTAQLARTLSTLLAGGTPLVEALRTAAGSTANRVYFEKLERTTEQVTDGGGLAQAVRATDLMPPMAARMIEVGEASGGLDGMLGEVARFHEELLDTKLTRVMSLIEPVLMLLIGVIIGGIIIVMYLPVFHVADIIK